MSFAIFVTAFRDGEGASLPLSTIRERFEKHVLRREDDGKSWHLAFGDESLPPAVLTYRVMGSDQIGGFAIERPHDDVEFWAIIAGILRDYPCVLYWPGTSAVMGSLDLLSHLPKTMVEKLGIPLVSTDPERIRQHVWDHS